MVIFQFAMWLFTRGYAISIDMETQRHRCIDIVDIRYVYFESNEEEVNSRNKKEGEHFKLPNNCMFFDSGHPKSSLG